MLRRALALGFVLSLSACSDGPEAAPTAVPRGLPGASEMPGAAAPMTPPSRRPSARDDAPPPARMWERGAEAPRTVTLMREAEGMDEEGPSHPPLEARVRQAFGDPSVCFHDVSALPDTVEVFLQVSVSASGVVQSATARGTGLNLADVQCLQQRAMAMRVYNDARQDARTVARFTVRR